MPEEATEARRYLRCLGHPALHAPTGEQIRFRTKKHLAVLVYLAVEAGQVHRRERLAELFWPKFPVAEARHSLATALSILRPRLGPGALESSRDHVRLIPGRIDLDLDRLRSGDIAGDDPARPLEIAGFLEGFDIADARDFSLWKDRQQAGLLPSIMEAFNQLVDNYRRHGDTRQVEKLAERMLRLDDLCEEAIRAKMESLTLRGDRLAALRLFEDWRVRLAQDLQVTPSQQLENMAASLRARGWERAPVSEIPEAPPVQRGARAFVGRTLEYRILYEAWESTRRGKPVHIMLLGDSGIGKTTLVERLTTLANLEGAAVSRVQCYDLERDLPYAAVSALITGLLGRPEVLGTPPEALAELARSVPQVRHRFPGLPPARDIQGEAARIELTESLQQLIDAVAEEVPAVLVIDDFHFADDASLAVLHLLLRKGVGRRVMAILIARRGELTPSSSAARLREASSKLGIRELDLAPLSIDESRELLEFLASEGRVNLPRSVKRTMIQAASGFPMVLELLLQDWHTHGDKAPALALEAMTTELGTDQAHAAVYRQFLGSMLNTVDPATKSVLQLASVLGPRLNDLPMYGLVNLSLGQTMSGLAQLADLRVLRDGTRGLEFVNELIRAQVYASVPSTVRRALHGAIADRLISSDLGAPGSPGLEVAWHCVRAGRQTEAVPHLLRGARQAMRQGAPHLAERALESALPSLYGNEHNQAELLLVESLQEQGRWRESLDKLALLGDLQPGDTQRWAIVLAASARMNLGAGFATAVTERVPDLLAVIRESQTPRIRIQAARVVAYIALRDWDESVARKVLQLLAAIEFGPLDEDAFGELALTRGLLLYLAGETALSRSEVDATVGELQRRGTANLIAAQLLVGLGTLQAREGAYEEAVDAYRQALRLATRLGNDTMIATILGNLGVCLGRLGLYEEQAEVSSYAPQPWGAEFGGFIEVQLAYCQAFSHAMRGSRTHVDETIAKLEQRMWGPLAPWIIQAWELWKGDLYFLTGNIVLARHACDKAIRMRNYVLLSPGFAGPFARWLEKMSITGVERKKAAARVREMLADVRQYDALDYAQILSVSLLLDPQGEEVEVRRSSLSKALAKLPPATIDQLVRLQALPPY